MSAFQAGQVPLIPRKRLFGNPSRVSPKLSPDGRRLSWLAPVDGVLNVWVAPTDSIAEAQPVTAVTGRPMVWQDWSQDGRFVLFLRDGNGDENYSLFAVSPETREVRNLTPMPGVSVRIYLRSPDLPGEILVGLNDRDARWHDVWKIDLHSGARALVYENHERFGRFLLDWQGRVRLAARSEPSSGGEQIFRFEAGTWRPWRLIPFEDWLGTGWIFFNRAGTHLLALSSIGRDRTALLKLDMATDVETVLAEHPRADIGDVLYDPRSFEIDAVAATYLRQEWQALNPEIGETLARLRGESPDDEFFRVSYSADNALWLVERHGPLRPATYFLVDRAAKTSTELFSARPELKSYRLAPMQGVVIPSRDGLDLVSYLTLPADEPGSRPRAPLPMVLVVHGGPWGRDGYEYRRDHQWLANRGYAVLSVNYRASTGFGKAFVNAGDGEHAAKMHDDLIDAVEWAIAEGVALREKIAITGGSYGGYAAFVGATFTPDVFCCAVPIVGITELQTLLENPPPYWADFMEQMFRRYADPRTEEGRAMLRSRSPLYKVDRIRKPMLIGHGANDVRCTLAQSDLIVAAMRKAGLDVTYVVFPDEGHGFYRPENNLAFNAITEAFFARHLGGRAEPVGDDFQGSSHEIRAGADVLEGDAG